MFAILATLVAYGRQKVNRRREAKAPEEARDRRKWMEERILHSSVPFFELLNRLRDADRRSRNQNGRHLFFYDDGMFNIHAMSKIFELDQIWLLLEILVHYVILHQNSGALEISGGSFKTAESFIKVVSVQIVYYFDGDYDQAMAEIQHVRWNRHDDVPRFLIINIEDLKRSNERALAQRARDQADRRAYFALGIR
ncbi:MAG: hypothetical protein WC244_01125 [Patescibacteria group bacterium]